MGEQKKGNGRISNIFTDKRNPGRRKEDRQEPAPAGQPQVNVTGEKAIVIVSNQGSVYIGDRDNEEEESALSRASKLQLTDALHELRQLTTMLRELVTQLRRLAPISTWTRHIKTVISKVESSIANHLSTGPILASSICRALFADPWPPCPQAIDLTALPANSPPSPLNPAYINLTVAAQH